ncbi:MAG: signal peptidase I [Candidatus Portnoybacteria bacterium CG06_land_8_20_14_3_00_39_12]|uniref:Signal peptidase I n=2 Tax=Candidatus Portnoyibacteriota TaxID=1817913 RepID=A0A2M7UI30_9BACT|nr:MAG: signal peptidase I [Candidatus Portnoybacteria bacterium CG06_land_8_20_14_3_00_39_12]PIZ70894.1 MAG: signal peptidase I [Candidatus Portnoybacteria bacterium CG_4_10_14_0_2_um_filter_39_11]
MNNKLTEVLKFIWELVKIFIVVLVVVVPIRVWVMQPFFVSGASMEPNFENGEYLIVDEISYRFSQPQRGDVIVFRYPQDPRQYFIKRIIGLPGESIKINSEGIYISSHSNFGFLLDEASYLSPKPYYYGEAAYTLSEDEYFVMGDNRDASSDSRRWGPVPRQNIIGKTWVRAWPIHKIHLMTAPTY